MPSPRNGCSPVYAGSASIVSRARLSWADWATASTSESSDCTRYAAWKAPWWATPSSGRDDRVLRRAVGHGHDDLLGERRAGPSGRRAPGGSVRRLNGSWIRAGTGSGPISSRIVRHTHCDPGNGVATSTAGLNASALPRTAAKSIAAMTAALRARRSRSDDGQRGVGEDRGVARHEGQGVARAELRAVRANSGRAGPLAAQHQRGGRERGQVGRAHAAALADGRQRVGGEHRLERVEHRGADPVAVGGQLVEPDQQHRPHPLRPSAARPELVACDRSSCRAWESGSGCTSVLVGADAGGAAVDRPVLGDPVGEDVRRRDACAGRRLHVDRSPRRATVTISSSERWLPSTVNGNSDSSDMSPDWLS